jgi:hypothetical protein
MLRRRRPMLGANGGSVSDRYTFGKLLLVAVDNLWSVRLCAALSGALAMLRTNVANNGIEMGENEARVVRAFGAVVAELASSSSVKVTDLHV